MAKQPVSATIRTAYDNPPAPNTGAVSFKGQPLKTEQHHKNDCDINTIVKRVMSSGLDPFADRRHMLRYVDAVNHPDDLMSAFNLIKQANEDFEMLPSDIRERFNNNPQELMNFVHDKSNYAEAVKMGLVVARKTSNESTAGGTPADAAKAAGNSPDGASGEK